MAAAVPTLVSSATAQTAATAKKETKAKKPPSAGMTAMRERQKKCGADWKEAKAAGKVAKDMNGRNIGATATNASRAPDRTASVTPTRIGRYQRAPVCRSRKN